ncbi:MAG: 16S rRNA (cytosine(967)-C(5))-methyltransferase RsmB [Steroidobacteraceae bacterium]
MSTPAEIRAQAALLLMQVVDEGRSLDALLENRSDAPQERGLLRSLSYGSVRWYWRLLAVLTQLSSQPPKDLQPEVRALALVGLFQLLHTDIAAHAAVAETVEAARVLKLNRTTGFLNAILRRCQRESEGLSAAIDVDLAQRTAHPEWLVKQLRHDWPAQTEEILHANNQHPPFWLRVNTRHIGRDAYRDLLTAQGLESSVSEYAPEALLLPQAVEVLSLPGFKEGWVAIQDAAAQLAAHFLAAEPEQRVLDACAAPGGKTCHILELQPQLGEMVALDVSSERMPRVRGNLRRLGLEATLIVGDAADPERWWDGQLFERILLDVPCSATGVIRRHPDIKVLRRATDIDNLAVRQAQMLRRIWPLLAPGGRLVYASCSALRAENAVVVASFLKTQAGARDITTDVATQLGFAHAGQTEVAPADRQPGWAIPAGLGGMDGFYYACLHKLAG